MPKVVVYGRPLCTACKDITSEIQGMGVNPDYTDVTNLTSNKGFPENWRDTNATDVLAAYNMYGNVLPLVEVNGKILSPDLGISAIRSALEKVSDSA